MKFLVIHQGRRDNYQVALSLLEKGHEVVLVTSAYSTNTIKFLQKFLNFSLLKKLSDRDIGTHEGLTVHSLNLVEVLLRIFSRLLPERVSVELLTHHVYLLASKVLSKNHFDCIVAYNYDAFEIFEKLKIGGPYKIIFQCHPHPILIYEQFAKLIEGGLVPSNNQEKEFSYSAKYQAMLIAEPHLADHAICASSYTKKSLLRTGIARENITVIPYGVEDIFRRKSINPRSPEDQKADRITLLFVGQFVHRKGLTIIEAILKKIDFPTRVIFVGRGLKELEPAQSVRNSNVEIEVHWDVPLPKLVDLYHSADVFLFPSFVEGFAHVILEAMHAGCIPLVSDTTCGPDVIVQGESGFVIPVTEIDQYLNSLRLLLDLGTRNKMQIASTLRARQFTWKLFRTEFEQTVVELVAENINNKDLHS